LLTLQSCIAWVLSFVKDNQSLDISLPSFIFEGMTFTCSTLRKRLRIISISSNTFGTGTGSSSSGGAGSSSSVLTGRTRGQSLNNLSRTPVFVEPAEPMDYFGDATNATSSDVGESPVPLSSPATAVDSILSPPRQTMTAAQGKGLTTEMLNTRYPDAPSFDWTRLPLTPALPRHIQFARSIDWGATPLGPIETWSFDLRAMCNLIMGSPHVSNSQNILLPIPRPLEL
jgi:hypothetical protein